MSNRTGKSRVGRSSRSRRRLAVAGGGAVFALLAACGLPAGPGAGSDQTTGGSSPSGEVATSDATQGAGQGSLSEDGASPTPDGSSSASARQSGSPRGRGRRVAWVPFGPATQDTPTQPASWYGLLSENKDCAGLLERATTDAIGTVVDPVRAIYLATAHACLALSANAPAEWAAARSDLAGASPAGLGCLDARTYRFAADLLAAHAADPSAHVRTGPPSGGTACPYQVQTLSPATGTAGDQVTITGNYLWSATAVYFGRTKAADLEVDPSGGALTVTVPALAPGPVTVRVVSSSVEGPFSATAPERFTVTGTATPSPTGSGDTASPGVTGAPSTSGASVTAGATESTAPTGD